QPRRLPGRDGQLRRHLGQRAGLMRPRSSAPLYESIGRTYASARQPDPRIARQIDEHLGDASVVLNVGAGTGSYEPEHRTVVAVEPSPTMIAQRSPGAAPVIEAVADALPFADETFD